MKAWIIFWRLIVITSALASFAGIAFKDPWPLANMATLALFIYCLEKGGRYE